MDFSSGGPVVDLNRIATSVGSVSVEAARRKTRTKKKAPKVSKPGKSKSVVRAPTEWACRVELSVEVDFEGDAAKNALVKKLKTEITAAMETAVKMTARDLRLKPSDVRVRPTALDCVVTSGDYDPRDGGDHDFDD